MISNEIKAKGKIKIRFLGVLKGLAKVSETELEIEEEKKLKEIILELTKIFGEDFKNRVMQGEKVSPDLLVNYKGKMLPARNNEDLIIEIGSTLTIFSFVHGG